jgi:orotate phosphoribosyltransferase
MGGRGTVSELATTRSEYSTRKHKKIPLQYYPYQYASTRSGTRPQLTWSGVTPEQTLQRFEQTGAYLRGHFRLTSGLHSPEYLQCALVLQYPHIAEELGRALATAIGESKVDLVAAPAIGGLSIGHEVAKALGARFIFTERDPATRAMSLRRGFQVKPGERAIVIEDVVTTGGSSREVIDVLNAVGAEVLAAGSIIDRSGGQVELGVRRVALATLNVQTYPESDCPMCRKGDPVVKPGSRPV